MNIQNTYKKVFDICVSFFLCANVLICYNNATAPETARTKASVSFHEQFQHQLCKTFVIKFYWVKKSKCNWSGYSLGEVIREVAGLNPD